MRMRFAAPSLAPPSQSPLQVLVIESCQGLVTAACAERMGGFGQLCACGLGDKQPPMDALRLMNLTQQQKAVLCQTSIAKLQAAKVRNKWVGQRMAHRMARVCGRAPDASL